MRKFTLFFVALTIWVLLVLPLNIQSFMLGIPVALIVAMLFGNYFIEEPGKFWELKRWAWFLYYIPVFAYHMILANFDVMYRVLHPLMPINPGIVKVKTRLKSKSGRAALCNSITL
ncbi:MAG: Na+/H+ antiporter subunit E, partial [bacterium]